jgi:hypothetical protein
VLGLVLSSLLLVKFKTSVLFFRLFPFFLYYQTGYFDFATFSEWLFWFWLFWFCLCDLIDFFKLLSLTLLSFFFYCRGSNASGGLLRGSNFKASFADYSGNFMNLTSGIQEQPSSLWLGDFIIELIFLVTHWDVRSVVLKC